MPCSSVSIVNFEQVIAHWETAMRASLVQIPYAVFHMNQ